MESAEIQALLTRLAGRRALFHSEADFQHELAWELRIAYPECQIRLERPFRLGDEKLNIDLLLDLGRGAGAIELKLWRKAGSAEHGGEVFETRSDGAKDCARYDLWADVSRVERLIAARLVKWGAVIALSDDPTYWTPPKRSDTLDATLRMHPGAVVAGQVGWSRLTGTSKGREEPIHLRNTYAPSWVPYALAGRGLRALVLSVR